MNEIRIFLFFNLFILFCNVTICSSKVIKCLSCNVDDNNCVDPIGHEIQPPLIDCDLKENVCYTKLDSIGRNERGCTKKENCLENQNCFKCTREEDLCNDNILPYKRPKCFVCSGKNCDNPVLRKLEPEYCQLYNSNEINKCFTSYKNYNIIRGCIAGAKKEDLNCFGENNCKISECWISPSTTPCNIGNITLENKCYSCSGKSDSYCAKEFDAEEYEECKEEKGCYERYKDGVASRGCAENLTPDELKACKESKNKNCRHCDLPVCNNMQIDGSGVIIISNFILISSILINWNFF